MASATSSPSSASAMGSPDPMQQDLSWLSRLSSQPVFASASASASSSTPRGQTNMITRGSDVIVLIDGQLRMMSLSAVKNGKAGGSDGSAPPLSSYKTLANPTLSEALSPSSTPKRVELTLNHSQTLLAISQPGSLIVVILPRTTALSSSSPIITVKAHKVGSFYHNSRSPKLEQITCTKWHPWSKRATSLLVLLRNGSLYEYDVARDLAEPQQSIHLLPFDSRHASPKLGVGGRSHFGQYDDDDEDELQAASFTLGFGDTPSSDSADVHGCVDWTPLTIYVLTTSGDVWAAAPFLPRNARVPAAYLQSLSAWAQQSNDCSGRQREYALRFVSNLLKQARTYQESKADELADRREPGRQSRATTPADILSRDDSSFGRPGMRKSTSAMSMSLDPEGANDDDGGDAQEDGLLQYVELKTPQTPIVPGTITAQGPFLLAPAPHELNESRESRGSDISFVRLPASSATSAGEDGAGVALELLLLLGDDGRIDVGVVNVAGKIGPKWTASQTRDTSFASRLNKSIQRKKVKDAKSGRYALSESSDEDDDGDEDGDVTAEMDAMDLSRDANSAAGELPVLFIYETLDLGFPGQRPSLHPPPRLVRDPVYQDTTYVQHAFGAHMLCLSSWATPLARLLKEADEEELRRFLHVSKASEVRWIVKIQDGQQEGEAGPARDGVTAVQVVDDIYLGYSLLVLLGDGDCFGLEMSLRATSQASSSSSAGLLSAVLTQPSAVLSTDQQAKKFYTSLLGSEPFEPPVPFAHSTSTTFPTMRLKTSNPSVARGELHVTPETLRLLGTSVQDLRGKMREVVGGGNVIQRRLKLQIKELHRQVRKLSEVERRVEGFSTSSSSGSGSRKTGGTGGSLAERLERVTTRQRGLIQRVDRVLQASMDSADVVGISKYEEVWLREMGAMEKELGRVPGEGLKGRVDKLQAQLAQLKPDLTNYQKSLQQQPTSTSTSPSSPFTSSLSSSSPASSGLGARQLERILAVLGEESERLVEAREKVHRLTRGVARSGAGAGAGAAVAGAGAGVGGE